MKKLFFLFVFPGIAFLLVACNGAMTLTLPSYSITEIASGCRIAVFNENPDGSDDVTDDEETKSVDDHIEGKGNRYQQKIICLAFIGRSFIV